METATEFRFRKGSGKSDRLEVLRGDRIDSTIECPKQGIVPHDMVHYAVESNLAARGFLGRVADGEVASFQMQAEAQSDSVERLVEVFQGDAWSGSGSDASEMLDLYQVTCRARGCPALAIDAEDIDRIRRTLADLTRRWSDVPVGGTLSLRLGD